jgi:hypothetical protein
MQDTQTATTQCTARFPHMHAHSKQGAWPHTGVVEENTHSRAKGRSGQRRAVGTAAHGVTPCATTNMEDTCTPNKEQLSAPSTQDRHTRANLQRSKGLEFGVKHAAANDGHQDPKGLKHGHVVQRVPPRQAAVQPVNLPTKAPHNTGQPRPTQVSHH